MSICLLISVDGKVSEVPLSLEELPTLEKEIDPMPYAMNIFYQKKSVKWFKLMKTGLLQWSKVCGQSEYRMIFAAPESWSVEGIEKLGFKNVNKTATYICKHHEVFGPALIFKFSNGEYHNLDKSDFEKIHRAADPKIAIVSETKRDLKARTYGASEVENDIKEIEGKEHLTQEDRELILTNYIDYMCNRMHLMSLELMYLLIAPQIYFQYVLKGKEYVNSIPSYAMADNMRDAYFFITFLKDAKTEYGEHHIYLKPSALPMVIPKNFDYCVETMTNIMKEAGLKYTAPVYKKRVITEMEWELINEQERKDKKRHEKFVEKQKEMTEKNKNRFVKYEGPSEQ